MKLYTHVIDELVNDLKEKLSLLFDTTKPYALLDFPDHQNVGDSAIWLGEVKLLEQLTKRAPSYVCTYKNFDAKEFEENVKEGPIFLHGGGNFGDIWPWYQDFRESILKKYPDRLIIQLPQTLGFSSQEKIDRCAKVIAQHKNFILMTRDSVSYDLAKENFQCKVLMAPDSALCLGPLEKQGKTKHNVLVLSRTDKEKGSFDFNELTSIDDHINADWITEPSNFKSVTKLRSAIEALANFSLSRSSRRFIFYQNLANGRLDRGVKLLSSCNVVVTDRLHAHILSTLLGLPNISIDNNYGKIKNFINAWTSECNIVHQAKTPSEVLSIVRNKA